MWWTLTPRGMVVDLLISLDCAASHVTVLSCDDNQEDFLTIADSDEESTNLLSHHRRTSWPMYFFAFSCTILFRASS